MRQHGPPHISLWKVKVPEARNSARQLEACTRLARMYHRPISGILLLAGNSPAARTVYSAVPSCAVAAMVVPTIRSGPVRGTLDSRSVALRISAPSLSLHAIFAVVMLPPLSTGVFKK